MATQVFTNLTGVKSAFDTVNAKTINLEQTCGSAVELNASVFSQLQDKVSETYCTAMCTAAGLEGVQTAMGGVKFKILTQAEYDAITEKDADTLYFISDAE